MANLDSIGREIQTVVEQDDEYPNSVREAVEYIKQHWSEA